MNGWQWAKSVLDNTGRALLLLLLFGVPWGGGLILWKHHRLLGIAAGVIVILVVCMFEGAFRTYRDAVAAAPVPMAVKPIDPERAKDAAWFLAFANRPWKRFNDEIHEARLADEARIGGEAQSEQVDPEP